METLKYLEKNMFKCDLCKKISRPYTPMTKKIAEIRKKEYEYKIFTKSGEKTKITKGWEIVKELSVCNDCADTEIIPIEKDETSNTTGSRH